MSQNNRKVTGKKRRAGVLAPLFSVYSGNSGGIGDFADLKLLIDWCEASGNSILQLLPMNETGYTFCPYDAVSSFALEPSYISIPLEKKIAPGRGHVDYSVKGVKLAALKEAFLKDKKCVQSKGFKRFISDNSYWLDDFVLFKAIKRSQGGKSWDEWDAGYKDRDAAVLKKFRAANRDELDLNIYVQYTAFQQLREAKGYAASKNILIKGDLPILVSFDSADVWAHPEYFKLDTVAGAPPDMYCAKGQRWGMPTYDWPKIAADGYAYLKEKMKYAASFYDILRVDHVVGLFRIWSIPDKDPRENEGLNGKFDPPDENTWGQHGRQILSVMINASPMLLCAEDLGIIPKACTEALGEFGIPGNEVQRWVKDWSGTHDFLPPKGYRECAVTMLSTHDTTNWPAWWENEAGTVDEALFKRMCADNNRVDYEKVKPMLFDTGLSRHGRLRWLTIVSASEVLVNILGRKAEELKDFIELYRNTYKEKEKLWVKLNLKGPMREECDGGILEAALKMTLDSRSIFAINLINDYLYLDDIFKGDPYKYRINHPGTVSKDNWSMTIPISLEKLLKHKVTRKISGLIADSGRT
jgi:4-alpha-glucanotransferase